MAVNTYESLLSRKEHRGQANGLKIGPHDVAPMLFDFQRDLVIWAALQGRAALFCDTGLGKTLMQIEWARQFCGSALIVAPLGVADQTIREGERLGVEIRRVRELGCLGPEPGISITNYERLHKFVGHPYDAIVLDESSILKSVDGKTRTLLLNEFTDIPYRLCCTATPAPNDIAELANHAQFLGVMSRPEVLATFFVHDSSNGAGQGGWRLKGHAAEAMYRWMASWAVFVRAPSDLGYDDDGFHLPALKIRDKIVPTTWKPDGMLFAASLGGIQGRMKVRRETVAERVRAAADVIRSDDRQWLVWCGLNDEGRSLADELTDEAVLIEGSHSEDQKIEREADWREGRQRVLITKPSIFGFGMNWQHCNRMIFLGLGDSYEQYYQAIRRCWRFGQKQPVECVVVISSAEGAVAANVRSKEREAQKTAEEVVKAMRDEQTRAVHGEKIDHAAYQVDEASEGDWTMLLGDAIERTKEIEGGSVGLSVFSPPFAALYTYSASPRDMGNSKDYDEFFRHFDFLIPELLRVIMPGRRCCVHVQQVTTTKATHGVIGWRDFRADVVRHFVDAGWVYDGEVVIDKDPQAQAIRTKSKALMFVQKNKDSAWSRPAMADYILLFRHPKENPVPVVPDVSNEEWIMWARPVWYGIRESDTLQVAEARDEKDERHICPLQLETIRRCVRLWSNPDETVFSPFAGIGSEGYVALQLGRKFVGIELKRGYYDVACKNLRSAIAQEDFLAEMFASSAPTVSNPEEG